MRSTSITPLNFSSVQIPIGLEEKFKGGIDVLRMKAYYFEGDMGNKVIEKDLDSLPENLKADAKKYHSELVEKIVETDDVMMTEYLEWMIPNMDILKKTLRKAVITNEIFPVFAGSALKNKGV